MKCFPDQGQVFISYRRVGGFEMARLIADSLRRRRYTVFMDIESLRNGPFNEAIYCQIEKSTDLVVILSPNSLDRCFQEGDWVRRELVHAFQHEKNIVPLIMPGFTWPSESLPDDLAALPHQGGVTPSAELFEASVDRLTEFLQARPRWLGRRAAISILVVALVVAMVVSLSLFAGLYRAGWNDRIDPQGKLSGDIDEVASTALPPKPTIERPVELSGDIDVLIWDSRNEQRRGVGLRAPNALPLRENDQIRIEAVLNRPAYVYIVWIDTTGQAFPVYPWQPGEWTTRPERELPTARISLPEQAELGWPIEGGPGMETLLLMARDTPLPRDVDLEQLFDGLPPQSSMQSSQSLVEFEQGTVVTKARSPERGPQFFRPQEIDDPVLQAQRRLQEKVGPHFPLTRAVSFANQAGQDD